MRLPPLLAALSILLLLLSATARAHGVDDSPLGDDIHAVDDRLAEIEEELLARRETAAVRRRLRCAARARDLVSAAVDADTAAEQARILARVARITRSKFRGDRALTAAVVQVNVGLEALVHETLADLGTLPGKSSLRRRVRALHRRADLASRVVTKLLWNARALRAAGVLAFGDHLDATFAITALGLAERGLDIDRDGVRDNSLSQLLAAADEFGLDIDVDALFAEIVGAGPVVAVLRIWSLESFTDDPFIRIGAVPALDTDGDTSDNASGAEEFAVSPLLLGDDGFPLARAVGTLADGEFSVRLRAADIALDGVALPGQFLVRIVGSLTPDGVTGKLGIAVPLEVLAALIEADSDGGDGEIPPLGPILQLAADVDVDGDGENDALGLVIDFEAAPASIRAEF